MENFIFALRDYMARHNLTQQSIARLIGCDRSAISRWLRGELSPSTKYYCSFIKLLEEEKNNESK